MKQLFGKLDNDKIKINWNKNPIDMKLFLSFLTVELVKSQDHLGYDMGWTKRYNKEHELVIRGGAVHGTEYLDSIEYGKRLSNPYNNYVNPFFLKDIMTNEGIEFFLDYYSGDIDKAFSEQDLKIKSLKHQLQKEVDIESIMIDEYEEMKKRIL